MPIQVQSIETLPSALRAKARWVRLTPAQIPALLVSPDWNAPIPPPVVLWLHGRTATKELDPGRYLRWMRAGIGACAIDLPGHGERFDASLQEGAHQVVIQMIQEVDDITRALAETGSFDSQRMGIGGALAGGLAALARLCRPHQFRCASVEATTGSWERQSPQLAAMEALDPIRRLEGWREIPFQAIHARHDAWVSFDGQAAFIDALGSRYRNPSSIDFVVYERTGAPHEHIGFGKMASDAKDRQRDFFRQHLFD